MTPGIFALLVVIGIEAVVIMVCCVALRDGRREMVKLRKEFEQARGVVVAEHREDL